MCAATGHLVPECVIRAVQLEHSLAEKLLIPNTTFQAIGIEENYLPKACGAQYVIERTRSEHRIVGEILICPISAGVGLRVRNHHNNAATAL